MDRFQIVFSDYANRDLEKIVLYIRRDNPQAAHRLGLKLIDRAEELAHPILAMAGSPLKKRSDVRKLVEGNYLIFYRMLPGGIVRILRFWHAARDRRGLRLKV